MDDYWNDENVVPSGSKQGQSNNIRPQGQPSSTAQSVSAELDALFADLPEDNPLPRNSTLEGRGSTALRRKGGTGGSRRGVNVLLSDNEEASGAGQPQAGADDDDASKSKKKRTIAKLDEERLRGPNGFPALIEQHKFKSSGKGNEAKDLQRLLQIYQLWSHKMYPKTQFRDTIERIEKLCHSRTMHIALNQWKEDLSPKPVIPSRDSSPVNEEDTTINDNLDDNSQTASVLFPDNILDSSTTHQPSVSRSRLINPGDDNDWDLEALIAEDIASRRQPESSSQPREAGSQKAPDMEDEWDVDAMIEEQEQHEIDKRGLVSTPSNTANVSGGEVNGIVADDEEMWNMVREIEMG